MENFIDNDIFIFCPKCSRLINVILFHFNHLNSKSNLYMDYFCNSCYEYSLKQNKEDLNNNKIKISEEKKQQIKINIMNENKVSISLLNYFKQFFYKPKTSCRKHKHNKMCLFNVKKTKEYICMLCLLEKNEKITRNILLLNKVLRIHYTSKKPCITKIRIINKESDCIKCIVSISPFILCYVMDKRVCVWDYSLNKILYTFVENNYIQNIIGIRLYSKKEKKNKINNNDDFFKEFEQTNLLLTYGSSLRLWNMEKVEKSKTPLLFQDNYSIIQEAIQIYNENLIAFLSEDGLFIWDFTIEKIKKYSDEINNVIQLSDLTSVFLFRINDSILSFGTVNKVYLYDYKHNLKSYIFTDNNDEEIVFGKNLSFNRLALVIKPDKLKIYEINTVIEEDIDENNINKYNKDNYQEQKLKINFECIYETDVNLGDDYWKFYLEEMNDLYLIGFFDKNEINLINIFTNEKEIIYKYKDNQTVDKNKKKIGIAKCKYLGKNKICLLINNESLQLLDIDKKIISTTFINPFYGQISTFKKLHNGDIAFGQIKQEHFYSIGILE